jgi:hypothetical protein
MFHMRLLMPLHLLAGQVKGILSTDGPEINPAPSTSNRLERLEVESLSSSALAILPGYAIDALAPTTLYNVQDKVTVTVTPPFDVVEIGNLDPNAQVRWGEMVDYNLNYMNSAWCTCEGRPYSARLREQHLNEFSYTRAALAAYKPVSMNS